MRCSCDRLARDVLDGAVDAHDPTAPPPGPARRAHPAVLPPGGEEGQLQVVGRTGAAQLFHRVSEHRLGIRWVVGEPLLDIGPPDLIGVQPVDAVGLRRPDGLAGVHVQLPGAHTRDVCQLLGPGALATLVGDIADHGVDQPVLQRRARAPRQPAVGTVPVAVPVLEAVHGCTTDQAPCCLDGAVHVVGVHQLEVALAHQFLGAPAEDPLPAGVHLEEVAVQGRDAQQFVGQGEEAVVQDGRCGRRCVSHPPRRPRTTSHHAQRFHAHHQSGPVPTASFGHRRRCARGPPARRLGPKVPSDVI